MPLVSLIVPVVAGSLGYLAFALWRLLRFRPSAPADTGTLPAVTVLKPLCGVDAGLYENLRSFCVQDYPAFQVVFGVAHPDDPAVAVVHKLVSEFPDRDLALVIDPGVIGPNLKISNLANMYPAAKHGLLVIADSDMRVGPDYLRVLAGTFRDPQVGAATCLYTGTAVGGMASAMAAAYINEWFLPSILVALAFRKPAFCFGATMAVRREALDRIGGFRRLAPVLADDYMLGKWVTDLGYQVRLAPYLVENIVLEPSFRSLLLHELRWARTIRSVEPVGYALSFVTYAIPMALLLLAVSFSAWGAEAVVLAVLLRTALHFVARRRLQLQGPARPWLVPLRDLLCFGVWLASFGGSTVLWREHRFSVQNNGGSTLSESRAP